MWSTLLHEQKKSTEKGGDWSFAELGIVNYAATKIIRKHTSSTSMLDLFAPVLGCKEKNQLQKQLKTHVTLL